MSMPMRESATETTEKRYDVAILGAGIAGSMLAAVLARNDVRVLLVDAGLHPRFAVGESTIPYTSALVRLISARYDVPEVASLATYKDIRDNVSRMCGWKKNFGFVYHRPERAQNPSEANQLVLPVALQTETHLYRQDVDAYMYHVALKYGADCRTGLRIADMDIDGGTGVVLRADSGEEFHAEYLVDARSYGKMYGVPFHAADLEARAPLHLGPVGLVLVGDMELDKFRDCDRVGDLELGALAGNIAHQAIEAGTPIVEIQSPLQEASLTQECAAFIGGGRHGRFRIAG